MNNEVETEIKIINKEKFLGRPCTEKEKNVELADTRLKELIRTNVPQEIDREEMLRIIKEENLRDYVHVECNSYNCPGEYYAVINKIKEYYTVLATGERGKIVLNSVFPKIEQAYYCLIEHMRSVKKDLERYNYRPFKNSDGSRNEGGER